MAESIYKVLDRALWQLALESGKFLGAEIDIKDGYIHFSTAYQLVETVRKHFAGREDLLVVEFDSDDFGDSLRWEVSRGGDQFPHLYASLDTALAQATYELPLSPGGQHDFSGISGFVKQSPPTRGTNL